MLSLYPTRRLEAIRGITSDMGTGSSEAVVYLVEDALLSAAQVVELDDFPVGRQPYIHFLNFPDLSIGYKHKSPSIIRMFPRKIDGKSTQFSNQSEKIMPIQEVFVCVLTILFSYVFC